MAETDVEILNIDTSKSTKSIKDLRQEIKDLRDQLLNLDKGTKEYNDTLVELADKTHDLKDAQEEIKRTTTDFGDRLSNIRGTITGVAGGFQAMIGTLSLLGVNLGDDVKMLKLLQSAMAITQGVAAIDAGVKSFKALTISIKASTAAMSGLKKALLSSGIGAIILLVGTLASGLLDMGDKAEDAVGKAQRKFDGFKTTLMQTDRELQRVLKRMKAEGASDKSVFDKEKEGLEAVKKGWNDMAMEIWKQQLKIRNKGWKYVEEHQDQLDELEKQRQEALRMVEETDEKLLDLQSDYENSSLTKSREAAKKRAEEKKADMAQIAKIEREAELGLMSDRDGELAKLKDTYDQQVKLYQKRGQSIEKLTEYYKQRVKEINDKYDLEDEEREIELWERRSAAAVAGTEKLIAAEQEVYARMQIETDNRLAADYSKEKVLEAEEMMERAYLALLDKKIELQKQLLENENLTADDYIAVQDNLLALQQERAEKSVAIEQKALEKRKKLNENYANAIRSITDSITSILGSVGETLEQGSEEWKAVMTTKAIISTIKGGVDAYMGMIEAIPGPAGIAAGALAAAATVAAGMAEVSKIQNTDISTSGSGGSTSTSTSLGSVNASAVQVAATQVTNTRQTPTTQDVEELPAQQVYVLEGDISRAQNNVRVTVEQATH